MSVCLGVRTQENTLSFRCMPLFRSIAAPWGTSILHRSSGTRSPTPLMKSQMVPRSWGKPYEPNAVIKNDIEFILMERKGGGYRKPTAEQRLLSVISDKHHKVWFQQIWDGLTGASTRHHPAPYPLELAERLIRMFSFVGDTVLDPFMGTGTTTLGGDPLGS